MQVTSALNRQPMGYDRSHYQQEMARARAQQQQMYPGMYNNQRSAQAGGGASASEDLSNTAQNAQRLQRQYANQVSKHTTAGNSCILQSLASHVQIVHVTTITFHLLISTKITAFFKKSWLRIDEIFMIIA